MTYKFKMVGSDPIASPAVTVITNEIIPIRFAFANGVTLDGSSEVAALEASPIYVNAPFRAGLTQYGDAVMRSEFWQYAANETYHVLLAAPFVEPTIDISVPAADGYTALASNGTTVGSVSYSWFVATVEPALLQQLSIDPTTLAIFVTRRTSVLEPSGKCCFQGYHSAFAGSTLLGPATFTTVWASVSSGGIEAMSHELAEWMNDPFYNNVVPRWLNLNGRSCGGNLLEVADPVTSYVTTIGGYEVQDVAFYSWFSQDVPSIGISGRYDLLGKLAAPAAACP